MEPTATAKPTWAILGFRMSHRALLIACGLVSAAVVTRLLWDRFLDPFEDGYQNWWIASVLAQTGRYADPFSGMTRGNWLPGYGFLTAGIIDVLGSHIMPLLKGFNIVYSLGTTGIIYLWALPRGRRVALLAATLFVLNPVDIVISSFATPEALTLFTTFLGVLLVERRMLGDRRSLLVAAAAFLVASTLRYEVWGFLLLYLGWKWATGSLRRRQLALVAGPALAFVAFWWIWTSQYGFLPAIIIGQTSVDVRYKAALGILPPFWDRLGSFFAFYLYYAPFVIPAMAWAVLKERRSAFTLVLFAFFLAEIGYTAANWGNPSPRYIQLTTPIVCIYAATGLLRTRHWLALHLRTARKGMTQLPAVATLLLSLALVVIVVNPTPPPGTLLMGMQRAGVFLSSRDLPPGRILVSESPVAAYYSGYPASRIIGSSEIPDDTGNATTFLQENAGYVIMVTVPYYKLRALFPQQANGTSGHHLILVYDATGPEYLLGAPRVLVFEVAP